MGKAFLPKRSSKSLPDHKKVSSSSSSNSQVTGSPKDLSSSRVNGGDYYVKVAGYMSQEGGGYNNIPSYTMMGRLGMGKCKLPLVDGA